jgi:ankyrin repeat protein
MKKGVRVEDEQFSDGFTLLMVHCENGNFGEVQKLFEQWSPKRVKTELNKTNNVGNTCLSLAVKN